MKNNAEYCKKRREVFEVVKATVSLAVWRIIVIYIFAGSLWILFSDRLLTYLASDSATLTMLQTVKGWLFIIVTALMLAVLIHRYTAALSISERKYRQSAEELMAANEELTAVDEELRQQFDELVRNQYKIDRQNRYLIALHETTTDLINELDLELLLVKIVKQAAALGNSQHGYLYLLDRKRQVMEMKVKTGLDLKEIEIRRQGDSGIVSRVWETGKPLVIQDYNSWEDRLPDRQFGIFKVSAGFPLKTGGDVIGVFGVNYTESHEMDDMEMHLMCSFAEMASVAVQNATLHSEVKSSQQQSRALIEALPDLVCRLAGDGKLLAYEPGKDFNPLYNLTGKTGKNIRDLLPGDLAGNVLRNMELALKSGDTQFFEYQYLDNGRKKYREARIVAVSKEEALVIVRDITERRELEERLRIQGLYDPVTGLYNRVFFEEELCRLNDSRHLPVGIIVCDIDGLKLVNDSLGHMTGDRMLAAVAGIIKGCFREGDVVARIGGDEFAILMPASDVTLVEQTCRSIREAVSASGDTDLKMPISLSIGMAVKKDATENINDVFKAADDNMYREKLHRAQSARSAIVSTLAKALEARDFVTDGHADRLQDLVEALAVSVGVPENSIADFRLLARFHDIGKVGIPDSILFKQGRLTPEEFEVMKRHSEIGYRIAQASPDLMPIAEWILKHHEWWNGQGYPLGLKGGEIPLACRILALADAYDAMTNDRPYRAALTPAEAAAEILRCAGVQFDPELAEKFVVVVKTK